MIPGFRLTELRTHYQYSYQYHKLTFSSLICQILIRFSKQHHLENLTFYHAFKDMHPFAIKILLSVSGFGYPKIGFRVTEPTTHHYNWYQYHYKNQDQIDPLPSSSSSISAFSGTKGGTREWDFYSKRKRVCVSEIRSQILNMMLFGKSNQVLGQQGGRKSRLQR